MQRRQFIRNSALTAFSVSAFGALHWNGTSFEGDSPTTTDILGPFYRPHSPMRNNLRVAGREGQPIILKGVVTKEDGKTPVRSALVEIWHCDDEGYDNTSDEFMYRGSQKTSADGKYSFKSILPVPYKADVNDETSWRPAHIHMRVSVPGQQDLVTQIYFKGGQYVDKDAWSSAPHAVNRILDVKDLSNGESEIVFNVVLKKEYPLEASVYDRICGLYDMGEGQTVEFTRQDDALHMKRNGQLSAALSYKGNNTFQEGDGVPKVTFTLGGKGAVTVEVAGTTKTLKGTKYLKY